MSPETHTNTDALGEEQLNRSLLKAAVKLNTWLLAGIFACMFGLSLLGLTYLSLFRGLPDTGQYLNLLGVFFLGYEVSHTGAWIGLFWGAAFGALFAIMFYRIYVRSIDTQIQRLVNSDTPVEQLRGATLFLDGRSLGLALGTVIATGLIISTNWLVFRGTADESVHAMLLANYLPGYAIDLPGSLIAAMELFFFTYLMSCLFSWIYNRLALARGAEFW